MYEQGLKRKEEAKGGVRTHPIGNSEKERT